MSVWEGLSPPYRTIVADPPWSYASTRSERQLNPINGGQALHHYDTMSNAEIMALPVADLADDDAHLYLWVTNPRLYGARGDRSIQPIDIMEAWGFTYKTMLTWVKPGANGLGWYFRGQTEHVLFGTRGHAPIPIADRHPNVVFARRSRHSRKPDAFFDVVEQVSPAPRVELFAREPRLGWDSWGAGVVA